MLDFEARIAKIRHRFATTLESKIKDNLALVERSSASKPEAVAVADMYRQFHEMYAIGPAVGFAQTGKAARAAEVVVLEAHVGQRGLSETETASLKKALDGLWSAAQGELESMYQRGK